MREVDRRAPNLGRVSQGGSTGNPCTLRTTRISGAAYFHRMASIDESQVLRSHNRGSTALAIYEAKGDLPPPHGTRTCSTRSPPDSARGRSRGPPSALAHLPSGFESERLSARSDRNTACLSRNIVVFPATSEWTYRTALKPFGRVAWALVSGLVTSPSPVSASFGLARWATRSSVPRRPGRQRRAQRAARLPRA